MEMYVRLPRHAGAIEQAEKGCGATRAYTSHAAVNPRVAAQTTGKITEVLIG
ncbi:hypothetical protein [Streptomyces sp. NPDC058620]|uniref:hypothetical protein n=1 Tax=Streptomyces sp. NPDC058620 TaxID=3346560 RepID=UPI0036615A1E